MVLYWMDTVEYYIIVGVKIVSLLLRQNSRFTLPFHPQLSVIEIVKSDPTILRLFYFMRTFALSKLSFCRDFQETKKRRFRNEGYWTNFQYFGPNDALYRL